VFAMMVASPSIWQTLSIFGALVILVLGAIQTESTRWCDTDGLSHPFEPPGEARSPIIWWQEKARGEKIDGNGVFNWAFGRTKGAPSKNSL